VIDRFWQTWEEQIKTIDKLYEHFLDNLGSLYVKNGEYKNAIFNYIRLIELKEKKYGKNHSETAKTYNELGLVHAYENKLATAKLLLEQSLTIREENFGIYHIETASSFCNLGIFYDIQGDLILSIDFLKRSLKITEEILGENHPDTSFTYNQLGIAYSNKQEYDEALFYYKKCLQSREKIYGANHPETTKILSNIGITYDKANSFKKAIKYFKKAHSINAKVCENSEFTLNDCYNLASMYYENKDYFRSYIYIQKAVKIKEVINDKTSFGRNPKHFIFYLLKGKYQT
jgi:tetratricopeptide (TPR) repeat protein